MSPASIRPPSASIPESEDIIPHLGSGASGTNTTVSATVQRGKCANRKEVQTQCFPFPRPSCPAPRHTMARLLGRRGRAAAWPFNHLSNPHQFSCRRPTRGSFCFYASLSVLTRVALRRGYFSPSLAKIALLTISSSKDSIRRASSVSPRILAAFKRRVMLHAPERSRVREYMSASEHALQSAGQGRTPMRGGIAASTFGAGGTHHLLRKQPSAGGYSGGTPHCLVRRLHASGGTGNGLF